MERERGRNEKEKEGKQTEGRERKGREREGREQREEEGSGGWKTIQLQKSQHGNRNVQVLLNKRMDVSRNGPMFTLENKALAHVPRIRSNGCYIFSSFSFWRSKLLGKFYFYFCTFKFSVTDTFLPLHPNKTMSTRTVQYRRSCVAF